MFVKCSNAVQMMTYLPRYALKNTDPYTLHENFPPEFDVVMPYAVVVAFGMLPGVTHVEALPALRKEYAEAEKTASDAFTRPMIMPDGPPMLYV
jgi:hypothetical protein